jgi:glycosyltransferase involved in cell wall biosynthesis
MSKVSVIMPAYNAGRFIKEAIESLLDQTHKDWELLILDDASSDNTLEIVSSYDDPRISIFKNDSNQGYLKSCNRLFELAKGEYLTFLDADDTCSTERLKTCISEIANRHLDFVTTDFSKIHNGGKTEDCKSKIDYEKVALDWSYYPTICCATIFVKSNLVNQIGGYNLAFDRIGAEDYHWLFRLSRKVNGFHLPINLYNYRQHENQIRNQTNPANFIAHDLDIAIRKSLIETGVDLLVASNGLQLEKIKAGLVEPFGNDETLILRYQSIQNLNSGKWGKAFSTMFNAISIAPFNMANWQRLSYIAYVIFRRFIRI